MQQASDPEFHNLVDPNPRVEKISGGFGLTRGPVFSRVGYLLFSDIASNRVLKWRNGTITTIRNNSNGATSLTFDHQGRLIACERGRITRTEKDGRLAVLASKGLNYPNDVVYAIDGSIYFTDLPAGAVYQITRKSEVRIVSRDCEKPSGVALAPNQQKLYVADGGQQIIRVYEIASDGALQNGRAFAQCRAAGLKTDEAGNVWAAEETGISAFNSQGKRLGSIPIPESPNNCNWGEGFRNLYITAQTSVYRLAAKVNGTRTY